MCFFWDLIHQSAIQEQSEKSNNLKESVLILEKHLGKDIDGDGKLG